MHSTFFTTNQFTIRELHLKDLPEFHEMQGNPMVMQYATGKVNTLEENRLDLEKRIRHYSQTDNRFWVWAIERKADKAFVGTCALVGMEEDNVYEIGFRFLEKYWGHGYGKEICNALVTYGFCQDEVLALIAYVDVRNTASVKILDQSQLGFLEERVDESGATERVYKMEIEDGTEYADHEYNIIPNQ